MQRGGENMNKAILKDNRNQIRGDRRQKRKALADNDPDKVEGKFEELYRFLEERYGYSNEKTKEEVDRRIRR
jgi:uncharacterized protein YjbJ (UPF0337 family)